MSSPRRAWRACKSGQARAAAALPELTADGLVDALVRERRRGTAGGRLLRCAGAGRRAPLPGARRRRPRGARRRDGTSRRRRLSVAAADLPAGAPVRARDRRAVSGSPEGHPWLKPVRFARGLGTCGSTAGTRTARLPGGHGLLPRRGRRGPRGRRRAGARRRHRAGALPLPVPRRAGLLTSRSPRLPAPRRRASAGGRPGPPLDPLRRDGRRRHHDRPRDRLLRSASRRSPERSAARRAAQRCAASRSSSSGSPTTPATSARWRATSASCRPRRTAAGSAATS